MGAKVNNLINKETTKKEWLANYSDYPATLEGGLEEKPYYENRVLPIYYEIPLQSKVLDIGCNDGTFMQILETKKKCEVVGIDVSDPMIELCHKKGLNALLQDADNLPFPDSSFDVVCLMEVYNHLIDPIKVMKEIKRVLKPEGFFIGSSPHKNLERHLWDDKRLHRRYQDKEELTNELKEVFEFQDIKVLTGAQFSTSFAGTFMAEQPGEMLFKCASAKGKEIWGSALQDKSILRAWFGGTTNPATFYYRMGQFCDKMQEMGAETFYEPYELTDPETFHRWQLGVGKGEGNRPAKPHVVDDLDRILNTADMSIFQITAQKGCLAFLMAVKAKYKNKPMLVELDDWIFDLPSYNHAAQAYHPRSDAERTALDQIKLSDGVICSTQYIKDMLGVLFPTKPVYIVPNAINTKLWDSIPALKTNIPDKEEGCVRLGYTGCDNHTGDLEIIKKPVMAILEEFPNVQMVFPTPHLAWDHHHPQILISDRFIAIDEYPGMIKGWDMDIGLAPLMDNHANRAKSNLRWLEYSALGVPVIASDIYPFSNSIIHNLDGILVGNSPNQWYNALRNFIKSKEKRSFIGGKAYKRVKEDFDLEITSAHYLELLEKVKASHEPHPAAR